MSTNLRHEGADDYLIHSDLEMARLERQAAVYGTRDDLDALGLSGDEQVLDLGCGAGTLTRTIAQAVPRGRVFGIDRNAHYIAYALNRARADGLENADFVHGDAASLPFDDDRFDVVWSKHLLQWMAHPLAAIEESVRVPPRLPGAVSSERMGQHGGARVAAEGRCIGCRRVHRHRCAGRTRYRRMLPSRVAAARTRAGGMA